MRPGTDVIVSDAAPPRSAPTGTDVLFAVGLAGEGPLGPQLVTSLDQFRRLYGARVSYGALYDGIELFYREGGSRAYISRVVGPAAVTASITLKDVGTVNTLKVAASSPGAWGNNITVQVATVTGGYQITVRRIMPDTSHVILEQSPVLVDKTAAMDWSELSSYVTITVNGGGANPTTLAETAMTLGADDRASVTDADWLVGLNRFAKSLGPGQVTAFGNTSQTTWLNMAQHAANNNRLALIDGPDTNVAANVLSAVATFRAAAGDYARFARMDVPWVRIAGLTPNTTRDVGPSAMIAGMIARSDGAGNPTARPAANLNGVSRAVRLLNNTFTDSDVQALYNGGVNPTIPGIQGIMCYGDVSLADPAVWPLWTGFAANRTTMRVAANGDAILKNHVFAVIDGQGQEFSKLQGELLAMLIPLWEEGSLFGDTFDAACRVDTSDAVNTPATIAAREIHAAVEIRNSKSADYVLLNLVLASTTEALG